MAVRFESGKPIFLQLEEIMRNDIAAGRYQPDEKLPGVRDLALWANVNPNTMQRALSDLEAEGLVVTRGTSGRFVTSDREMIESARQKIIKELTDEFVEKCASVGVMPAEAAELLLKRDNNERTENHE
ncbi:MAG: GntR family transcriptional regulator [Clostridia bacterium]|nr:GntR family transcriptional regulator [Clostridia bacterium]